MSKQREKIELTSDSLRNLVYEEYLMIADEEVHIEVVDTKYEESSRHQEYHSLVFERLSDNKFFRIGYSESDTMGWDECNYSPFEAVEVFPKTIQTIIYE